MSKTITTVGPQDHGRRMTLQEFDKAEGMEGHLYELARGVVVVSDVPKPRHFAIVDALRTQLYAYSASHPGIIHRIGAGSECKILLFDYESERHPDISVYKTPPTNDDDPWATWVPEIVVEVVSPGSEHRDYIEKREEYFGFGVREYWIVDFDKQQMLALRRSRGRWVKKIVRASEVYRTRLLPGFELDLASVFQAAGSGR